MRTNPQSSQPMSQCGSISLLAQEESDAWAIQLSQQEQIEALRKDVTRLAEGLTLALRLLNKQHQK